MERQVTPVHSSTRYDGKDGTNVMRAGLTIVACEGPRLSLHIHLTRTSGFMVMGPYTRVFTHELRSVILRVMWRESE